MSVRNRLIVSKSNQNSPSRKVRTVLSFRKSKNTLDNSESQYVSRAGYKLKYANQFFKYNFKNKIVLDIGSSTGGFTDYALQNGAGMIFAVEIGTNQMHPTIKSNPKVFLYEKTDFLNFLSPIDIPVSVILADVSFISLTKILKSAILNKWASNSTDFLVMLKPQFEAPDSFLKNGILKNSSYRRRIISDFELWLKKNNFIIIKKRDNHLAGKNGNIERFYHLKYVNHKRVK